MPIRSVDLTDHLDSFIETGIQSGRFTDASQVVREGLTLLEQRQAEDQAKLEWLRAAVQEGIDSLDRGEGIRFESMDEVVAYIDQIAQEVEDELQLG